MFTTLQRPRFKRHLLVEPDEEDQDRVLLVYETGGHSLHGRLSRLLAPHLDGRSTVSEIAERLAEELTPLDVSYGISLLEQEGVLAEGTAEDDGTTCPVFRDLLGVAVNEERQRLQDATVSVASHGTAAAEPLVSQLCQLGIRVGEHGDLRVVLVDDYLCSELAEVCRDTRQQGRSLLIARPLGTVAWLGPLFSPQRPGCWCCLADRLRGNRATQARPPLSRLPSLLATAYSLLATTVYRWVVQEGLAELEDRLLTFDMLTLQSQVHTLVPRPDCPHCGAPLGGPEPLRLSSRSRVYRADGGYRVELPEETWQRVSLHVSPLTGIVRELRPHQGEPGGPVHVWVAGPNLARLGTPRRPGLRSKSAGKGRSEVQARLGAVCEALERYSGLFQGNEPRELATCRSLGNAAIAPERCLLFSQQQYRNRDEWNREHANHNWVPPPFGPEQEIEWTPLWSLRDQTCRYLPTGYCYFGYPFPGGEDTLFCRPDSNGNAAGTTLEEAILQGFFELVERDAVALWWYNRSPRPGVELGTFSDQPYFPELQEYYRSLGRELRVLDITSDLGIPAFAALSGDGGEGGPPLILGFGAHFEATIAISRALTELNQLLANVLGGRGEEVYTGHPTGAYLQPDPETAPRAQSDFAQRHCHDLGEEVERCVAIAAEHDLDTLVLDQTRPEVGLRVVKVVVPGLRPFWARFAPGRLYQAPVTAGWLDREQAEHELNPSHLTL